MASAQFCPNACWSSIIRDPEWLYKAGIGGAINALSVLLIATNYLLLPIAILARAFLMGYLLRTIRGKLSDEQAPLPAWGNPIELMISGLTWLAVESILFLTPLLITAIALLAEGELDYFNHLTATIATVSVMVVVLSFWIVTSFLTPFLMVNFAVQERFTAGLAFKYVIGKAIPHIWSFIACWLLILGIQLAAIVLPILTIVGIFLIPTVIFLSQLMSVSCAAQVFNLTEIKDSTNQENTD